MIHISPETMVKLGLFLLLGSTIATTLSGRILGVTESVTSRQQSIDVLNGANYASRFSVDLFNGESQISTPVDKQYRFLFDSLEEGNYLLSVSSYDFLLDLERFRLFVGNDSTIVAYKESLFKEGYNKSSKVILDSETPLNINVIDIKEYYELPKGSLMDMVNNSPFGFIFKNKIYTGMFVVSLIIMATPYLIKQFAPELMEEYEELKKGPISGKEQPEILLSEKIVEVSGTTSTSRSLNKPRKR